MNIATLSQEGIDIEQFVQILEKVVEMDFVYTDSILSKVTGGWTTSIWRPLLVAIIRSKGYDCGPNRFDHSADIFFYLIWIQSRLSSLAVQNEMIIENDSSAPPIPRQSATSPHSRTDLIELSSLPLCTNRNSFATVANKKIRWYNQLCRWNWANGSWKSCTFAACQ